ncbi:SRPBCC family protein [Nocardia nova]|uniref:SRPBCC family protein n=1 Tax=Nocardia nova TaxID=37330 RepID=A0A2S6AV15_9NOCA|nr:SRPBCC family protein [Nocardia nova]PPJ32439.1 SRPBCC family protein [Nocardia nova]PPJ39050.1 SRPBCC family protein [Nocardia nova]
MGHIRYASDVGAPVEVAFTYTDNHRFVPDWMFGIAAFEPVGAAGHGPGAVFAATFRLGLWHPTVDCEITEYRRNAVIGYTLRRRRPGKVAPAQDPAPSLQDPEPAPALATLTLRFDPLGHGRSVLTSEADYPPAHGWLARPAAKAIDALAQAAVRRSETQLRREIEEFHGTDLVGRIA